MWGYLDDPRLFFCFVLVVHESLVCSEQLNWAVLQTNPPRSVDSAVFQHIWTLSSSDCMILRSIFSHWGQLMDSNTTIKKGSNIHWCSRRTHDALRAGCWKLCTGWRFPTFFFCWNIYFFSIYYCPSEATEDTCMFPGRQIKYNLPWSSNSKSFHPPAINASCVLLEHQWMFEPFLIVVFESLNCPQCEKMDLKIIQSLLERVQICKNAGKLQNLQNVEDLSEEQLSSTVQNKQGTHEQPTQNKRTVVDHPGNLTQY